MTEASIISGLADLSEAAYLDFGVMLANTILDGARLKDKLVANPDAWPIARADEFIKHWRVVAHQPNTGGLLGPGFSGTVFERIDLQLGESRFVVALRGTEGNVVTQNFPDLLQAGIPSKVHPGK